MQRLEYQFGFPLLNPLVEDQIDSQKCLQYSNLPNKRRASLNYFQPIFPPRRSYLAHFYNSLLNKTAGTFIYFLNFFPPRRLLSPVRLLSKLEYSCSDKMISFILLHSFLLLLSFEVKAEVKPFYLSFRQKVFFYICFIERCFLSCYTIACW